MRLLDNLDDAFYMEETVSTLDWRPVATAPANVDLELSVYEQ
jgi:hypothetical protein